MVHPVLLYRGSPWNAPHLAVVRDWGALPRVAFVIAAVDGGKHVVEAGAFSLLHIVTVVGGDPVVGAGALYQEFKCQRLVQQGAELGADIIKTNYTGDPETFQEVIEGCPVPLVIAGDPRVETDEELLEMVKNAVDVGGAGVAIGRNIFQAESPQKTTRAIAEIVHNNIEADEALKILQG